MGMGQRAISRKVSETRLPGDRLPEKAGVAQVGVSKPGRRTSPREGEKEMTHKNDEGEEGRAAERGSK